MYLSLFHFFPLSIYLLVNDRSRIYRELTLTFLCVFGGLTVLMVRGR